VLFFYPWCFFFTLPVEYEPCNHSFPEAKSWVFLNHSLFWDFDECEKKYLFITFPETFILITLGEIFVATHCLICVLHYSKIILKYFLLLMYLIIFISWTGNIPFQERDESTFIIEIDGKSTMT
jgi:hypothetical protein